MYHTIKMNKSFEIYEQLEYLRYLGEQFDTTFIYIPSAVGFIRTQSIVDVNVFFTKVTRSDVMTCSLSVD